MDGGSDDQPRRRIITQLLELLSRGRAEAERVQADTHRLHDRLQRTEALIKELQSQLGEGPEPTNPDARR